MGNPSRILWVDDDPMYVKRPATFLRDHGFHVDTATDVPGCIREVEGQDYDLVIMDVMIRNFGDMDPAECGGGHTAGLALARRITKLQPKARIVGCSVFDDEEAVSYFDTFASGFWRKSDMTLHTLLARVQAVLDGRPVPPAIFIVHADSSPLALQLKNFLQNDLHLGQPVMLREQPSRGRSVIEKFEEETTDVQIVFVLLTPEDKVINEAHPAGFQMRARQNVIFELGYFFGKLGRRSGRIIVLHQHELEVPSDIAGLVYIPVGQDFESCEGRIRKELVTWL